MSPGRSATVLWALLASCLGVGGCGLNVASADLFQLMRSGQGAQLTLIVNDGGTIRCDGARAKPIPDALLLQARALVTSLERDAKARLRLTADPGSVYRYTMRFQDGTISFADTSSVRHPELAAAELFALRAAHGPCGLQHA